MIGLLAAMKMEGRALLRLVPGWQWAAAGRLRGQSFELAGKSCLLFTTGMGARRAAEAAGSLVENYSPMLLVSFGIAGAVEAELNIGDVVLSESVCQLSQGMPGELTHLAGWPAAARQAMEDATARRGVHLYDGTAITTGGSQVGRPGLEALPHPILEMETAGIARVAAERKLPLLSLRAISDGPRAPIPIDLGSMMDENADLRFGRLLVEVLRRPAILQQGRQMMRNSALAAENAALALLAALPLLEAGG